MSDIAARIIGIAGTVVCLLLLIIKVILLVVHLFASRDHRIPYIRNYKKGSFITNYLVMLLIFFVGILYEGRDILFAFSRSVSSTFDFLLLRLDVTSITGLMTDYPLYAVTVYIGYFLVVLGAILLTLSVMQQHIWCALCAFKVRATKREILYVFGYNDDNLNICNSDGKRRFKYLIADLQREDCDKLYISGLPYRTQDPEDYVKKHLFEFIPESAPAAGASAPRGMGRWLYRLMMKSGGKKIIIINTGSDKQNIAVCKLFADALESLDGKTVSETFEKLRIYVFGDPEYQSTYDNLVKRSMGCVSYVNKYSKIAWDFIERYPLTLFMGCDQLDYETSLVKAGVDINVALVGFGKTNRQLLLSSMATNQFLTQMTDGSGRAEGDVRDPVHKPVKYFIFDKNKAEENKNFNHGYFRFKHKVEQMDPREYLPLPPSPTEERYMRIDINERAFYDKLKEIVTRDSRDANFIVVSFGNDLENLDMAQKLVEKCKEWGAKNVNIFVRAFGWRKEQTPLKNKNCYFFGDEARSVYNIDKILSDKIYTMAKMRSKAIDMERALARACYNTKDENYIDVSKAGEDELWYREKTQIQRDSSIYACLGIRFKLNLMGLDYREKSSGGRAIGEEEYLSIYAKDDLPDTERIGSTVNGKKLVYYSGAYKHSRRRAMAMQEHFRWSAFVISRGVVPAKKLDIQTEKKPENGKPTSGKNYELRRHGNLTTYEGLAEFGKLVVDLSSEGNKKRKEYEKDRYRYRYQILDDAFWLLDSNGFEIVSKISCRDSNDCDKLHGCIDCNNRKK